MSDEVQETLAKVRRYLAYARHIADYGVSELDPAAIGKLEGKELRVICDGVLDSLQSIIGSELAAAVSDLNDVIVRLRA